MNAKEKITTYLQLAGDDGASTQEIMDATKEDLGTVAYALGLLIGAGVVKAPKLPFTMENLALRWFMLVCALLLCSCSLLEDFDRFHVAAGDVAGDAGADGSVVLEADAGAELEDAAAVPELDAGADAAEPAELDAGAELEDAAAPDAGSPAPDAGGPQLPSCHDPGHELYFGGCGCTVSACACEAACWNGTAIVCCESNAALAPMCRCEP